ncbi:MAG: TVP38/TMEM64 family protein [Candidatus Omnitrophica bacterium]|nr:TVP38/TMEM64 family protein [Candidatus Omnitrophota bacterium]
MKRLKNPWIRLFALIIVLTVLFFIFRLSSIDFSRIRETEFRNWVKSLGVLGPLAYILIYLFRPLILFPAGVLSSAAGIIWGTYQGFFYLLIAANISSTAEFIIGRYFARDLIHKHLNKQITFIDKKIENHGFLTVLLIRLIPNIAWDIQNFSLSLTQVKFRDYFFATFIGIMPGSFAFVFLGSSLIKVFFSRNALGLFLAFSLFILIYYLRGRFKKEKGISS